MKRGQAYWDARHAATEAYAEQMKERHEQSLVELAAIAAAAMCPAEETCNECMTAAGRVVKALDSDGVVFARMSLDSGDTKVRS